MLLWEIVGVCVVSTNNFAAFVPLCGRRVRGMALVWEGGDWVRRGQGSDTDSDSEWITPAPERFLFPFADADTLEVAVLLVVFQRYARHFGRYRYRSPVK